MNFIIQCDQLDYSVVNIMRYVDHSFIIIKLIKYKTCNYKLDLKTFGIKVFQK